MSMDLFSDDFHFFVIFFALIIAHDFMLVYCLMSPFLCLVRPQKFILKSRIGSLQKRSKNGVLQVSCASSFVILYHFQRDICFPLNNLLGLISSAFIIIQSSFTSVKIFKSKHFRVIIKFIFPCKFLFLLLRAQYAYFITCQLCCYFCNSFPKLVSFCHIIPL